MVVSQVSYFAYNDSKSVRQESTPFLPSILPSHYEGDMPADEFMGVAIKKGKKDWPKAAFPLALCW